MLYTKPEEIQRVKLSLPIFEGRLSRLETDFAARQHRHTVHPLFFSLCNPGVYLHLLPALESIKAYSRHEYFPKAVKKLKNSVRLLQHYQTVNEIIVLGYYCQKFLNEAAIKVVWEQPMAGTGRNPDIKLTGLVKPVNIEVTSLAEDQYVRDNDDLSWAIHIAIEKMSETLPDQQFCYLYEVKNPEFTAATIPDFVNFIKVMRQNGEGEYTFTDAGRALAAVQICALGSADHEYTSDMTINGGWMDNTRRLRSTIINKARNQLPASEVNFVFTASLGLMSFDEIDCQQAFLGNEQWVVTRAGAKQINRAEGGAIHAIRDEGLSPVHAVIYLLKGHDYAPNKKLLINPYTPPDAASLQLVE